MVVSANDQGAYQADVVFVIEGNANISPYVDTLKRNYILPTLECFNGAPPDDRDCGCDANCTMYALVVFFAADIAPETSAKCFGPTANTFKFLSWLDKIPFIGGGGESHSHIAEGLSTALQVFDDFQSLRDSNNSSTQKHCILISNSPPYSLPALESSSYYGLVTEQLALLMLERQINLSIISPRKIPILFKIYEKAGGDLQHVLAKNYAKDRRHLVLLRGFQLQERPMTPPVNDSKNMPVPTTACSPPATGQKRPATNSPPHARDAPPFKQPATQTSYTGMEWSASESQTSTLNQNPLQSSPASVSNQSPLGYGQSPLTGQANQNLAQKPGIPTPPTSHINPMNQPNPPNVTITQKGPTPQHTDGIRPTRNLSPVPPCGPRISWNQTANPSSPVSTPPTTSVLATQLNMPSTNMTLRHNAPQMSSIPPVSSIVSQPQSTVNPLQGVGGVLNSNALRSNLPNVGLRMSSASSGPAPAAGANPLAVQLGQHQTFGQASQPVSQQPLNMPSTMQSKLNIVTSGNQMIPPPNQTMTTAPSSNLALQPMGLGPGNPQGQIPTKDRCAIWQGVIEYPEKSPTNQAARVTHPLNCTISSMVTNGDIDVNADKWPTKLVLQLIPRQLIVVTNLFSILKNAARHVLIHFTQESEGLAKLCKTMSSGLVGCIQFPQTCDIRIMVVIYMPDKKMYMGCIANDQESFFISIRQMHDNYKKQQQQKQRMQQLGSNIAPTDGMGLPSSAPSNQNMMMPPVTSGNLPAAGTTQMNARMPLNQPQVTPNNPPQAQAPNSASMVHSTNVNQQQQPGHPQSSRLSQLEAARQQNLLKIQQLQQTLEAAQQKELQYKAAQEQQQQQQQHQHQQHQQLLERNNALRQLHQQLQHQQQQLDQATAQQRHHQQQLAAAQAQAQANQQQQQQQNLQMHQVNPPNNQNPQLRSLLQQQVQQQMRRQSMQAMMQQQQQQQQHPQGMRPQLQGAMSSSVAQQAPQQQQQSWDNSGILDLLPP